MVREGPSVTEEFESWASLGDGVADGDGVSSVGSGNASLVVSASVTTAEVEGVSVTGGAVVVAASWMNEGE